MKTLFILLLFLTSLYSNNFYYEFGKKVELDEIKQTKTNDGILRYKTKDNQTIKFKNEIIVKCEKGFTCEDEFNSLDIENYKQLSKNFFLIYVQENQNIFELSQKLYNKQSIKLAHPNFIKERKLR